MARSREEFFKNNSLLNHNPKTNSSASKGHAQSVGAILGVTEDRRQGGPDYEDPEVRKQRWRQKLQAFMVTTCGLEAAVASALWDGYDQQDSAAIQAIEGWANDMKDEEYLAGAKA